MMLLKTIIQAPSEIYFASVFIIGQTIGVDSWQDYGFMGLLVGIILCQSWLRESRMAKRLDMLEDRENQTLKQVARALEAVSKRPCLADSKTIAVVQHDFEVHTGTKEDHD